MIIAKIEREKTNWPVCCSCLWLFFDKMFWSEETDAKNLHKLPACCLHYVANYWFVFDFVATKIHLTWAEKVKKMKTNW
jgi:hypothetical protein